MRADETVVEVPVVAWTAFLPSFLRDWGPNDGSEDRHVSIVGHNGSGKTTLAYAILNARAAAYDSAELSFVTKARDRDIARQRQFGWALRRKMASSEKGKESIGSYGEDRILFWPVYGDPQTALQRMARVIRPALQTAFKEGSRVVHFNEVFTLAEMGFVPTLKGYWREGRANRLIVVAETQRPKSRELPLEMWTEARHLFVFRLSNLGDIERVGEHNTGRVSTRDIAEHMTALSDHEFLYVNVRTGAMARSMVR